MTCVYKECKVKNKSGTRAMSTAKKVFEKSRLVGQENKNLVGKFTWGNSSRRVEGFLVCGERLTNLPSKESPVCNTLLQGNIEGSQRFYKQGKNCMK